MRLHRFYIDPRDCELDHSFWTRSQELRNQWLKVFRYREGDEVVLFDGVSIERLYKIARIEPDAIQLEMVTEFERKLPGKHVYMFWSLLKKDKNDWVIQKCTELGVSNFVPVIAERSEKIGFNLERAQKIAVEAAEQCGRSDIPHVREPLSLAEVIGEYADKLELLYAEEENQLGNMKNGNEKPLGILIGPEGGWTESELKLCNEANITGINLGNLTLRAETAAVAAATKLMHMN